MTAIRITVGGRSFAGQIGETATGRDLLALLPLTVELADFHGQEKLTPLPRGLSTDGAPRSSGADAGDIGYYAPSHDLVLYYAQVGAYPGIIPIGNYDRDAVTAVRHLDDGTEATITLA